MVKVEPWIKFEKAELDVLREIKSITERILSNLDSLEQPRSYTDANNKITAILTDMDIIQKDHFRPLLRKKAEIKKTAERINSLNQ